MSGVGISYAPPTAVKGFAPTSARGFGFRPFKFPEVQKVRTRGPLFTQGCRRRQIRSLATDGSAFSFFGTWEAHPHLCIPKAHQKTDQEHPATSQVPPLLRRALAVCQLHPGDQPLGHDFLRGCCRSAIFDPQP